MTPLPTTDTLTIYTRTTCAYCSMVKRFLDMKNKEYRVVNLDENPSLTQSVINMSGSMTVPITTKGSEVVVGWNPAKLMAII